MYFCIRTVLDVVDSVLVEVELVAVVTAVVSVELVVASVVAVVSVGVVAVVLVAVVFEVSVVVSNGLGDGSVMTGGVVTVLVVVPSVLVVVCVGSVLVVVGKIVEVVVVNCAAACPGIKNAERTRAANIALGDEALLLKHKAMVHL